MTSRYKIKIPKTVTILYCRKKELVTFIGPLKTNTLKLKLQLAVLHKYNLILVKFNNNIVCNNAGKKFKALLGTTVALIKQNIIEVSHAGHKKLKLIGIGYKFLNVEILENKLLILKLGFSHSIFIKIPKQIKMFCVKLTRLFIYGLSYQNLSKTTFNIRQLKKPEPYKGKGILVGNEKIKLKEGKRK